MTMAIRTTGHADFALATSVGVWLKVSAEISPLDSLLFLTAKYM